MLESSLLYITFPEKMQVTLFESSLPNHMADFLILGRKIDSFVKEAENYYVHSEYHKCVLPHLSLMVGFTIRISHDLALESGFFRPMAIMIFFGVIFY